ncbi:MAG TPA: histidine phosphatase family protein [Pyrinomonadaceae bacterium]|jgi:broad specificity phosphatase PhoE|nr:histidine phosphatase family protein [Pyrinomonadaceae bacterium]
MKEVWLIRHGESTANAGAATFSPESVPLTERGMAQARCIAEQVSDRPDLIVVSSFLRSQQTAAPLIAKYPDVKVEEWPVQEFTYLSPDRCHNTSFLDRKPLVAEYWARNDAYYCDGPGAESFANLLERALATVARIKAADNEFIVMLSHGQFLRGVIWLLLHELDEMKVETMEGFHGFLDAVSIPNAAIFKIKQQAPHLWFSSVFGSYIPVEIRSG